MQAWGEDETRETVKIILVPTDGGTTGQSVHGRKGRQQSLNFIKIFSPGVFIGNTCARTTWTLEPLVTGLVEPLGPLMQGLLETPGLTFAGHLVHGQVKEAPL